MKIINHINLSIRDIVAGMGGLVVLLTMTTAAHAQICTSVKSCSILSGSQNISGCGVCTWTCKTTKTNCQMGCGTPTCYDCICDTNCLTVNACEGFVNITQPGAGWTCAKSCQTVKNGASGCENGPLLCSAWTPPPGTTTTPCPTCGPGNTPKSAQPCQFIKATSCAVMTQTSVKYNGVTYYTCTPTGQTVWTYTCPSPPTSNSLTNSLETPAAHPLSNSLEKPFTNHNRFKSF